MSLRPWLGWVGIVGLGVTHMWVGVTCVFEGEVSVGVGVGS